MWSVRRHKYRSTTPRKHGKTQEKVRFYVHLNMTWDVQRTSCNTQNKQKCRNSMGKKIGVRKLKAEKEKYKYHVKRKKTQV